MLKKFDERSPVFGNWDIEEGKTKAKVVDYSYKKMGFCDYLVKIEVKTSNKENEAVKLTKYFRTRVNPEFEDKFCLLSIEEGANIIIDIYNERFGQGLITQFEIVW